MLELHELIINTIS